MLDLADKIASVASAVLAALGLVLTAAGMWRQRRDPRTKRQLRKRWRRAWKDLRRERLARGLTGEPTREEVFQHLEELGDLRRVVPPARSGNDSEEDPQEIKIPPRSEWVPPSTDLPKPPDVPLPEPPRERLWHFLMRVWRSYPAVLRLGVAVLSVAVIGGVLALVL